MKCHWCLGGEVKAAYKEKRLVNLANVKDAVTVYNGAKCLKHYIEVSVWSPKKYAGVIVE